MLTVPKYIAGYFLPTASTLIYKITNQVST